MKKIEVTLEHTLNCVSFINDALDNDRLSSYDFLHILNTLTSRFHKDSFVRLVKRTLDAYYASKMEIPGRGIDDDGNEISRFLGLPEICYLLNQITTTPENDNIDVPLVSTDTIVIDKDDSVTVACVNLPMHLALTIGFCFLRDCFLEYTRMLVEKINELSKSGVHFAHSYKTTVDSKGRLIGLSL